MDTDVLAPLGSTPSNPNNIQNLKTQMPRKSETLETPETVNDSALATQEPGGDLATLDFSFFQQEGFESEQEQTNNIRLPLAILLNAKQPPNHGLFIKESELDKAVWHGIPCNHANKFSGSAPPEKGLLLHGYSDPVTGTDYSDKYPAPRIQVLHRSPTYIEIKREGVFGLDGKLLMVNGSPARKGDVIGVYSGQTNALYKHLQAQGEADNESTVTLRTIYVIFLLDEQNQRLHDLPMSLSVAGGAGMFLNQSYDDWKLAYGMAFAKVSGMSMSRNWNSAFYANGVFVPTLGTTPVGKTKQSDVTCVQTFIRPNPSNFASLYLGKTQEAIEENKAWAEFGEAASTRFFEENEFHRIDSVIAEGQTSQFDPDTGEDVIEVSPL